MAKHSPITSLETYTQEVSRCLQSVPANIREEEVRELRGHLEQLTADLHMGGRSQAKAAQLAIGRFGEAHTVGVRLRDVWEGNRGVAVTLLTTVLSNWLLQVANLALFLTVVLATATYNDKLIEPLKPLFSAWMWGTVVPAPFVWNYLLGQWGGRRVASAALMAFVPFFVAGLAYEGTSTLVTIGSICLPSAPLACSLMAVAAFLGGWYGSLVKHRQRWALIGDAPRQHASTLLRRPPRVRILSIIVVVSVIMALSWGGYVVFGDRTKAVLYPQTPEEATRIFLSTPGYAYNAKYSVGNIQVKPHPYDSKDVWQYPTDVKQRLDYTATLYFRKYPRQKAQPHIALYDSQIQAACTNPRDTYIPPRVRAEVARLRAEAAKLPLRYSFTVRGQVVVVNTPEGWKMDVVNMKQAWAIG